MIRRRPTPPTFGPIALRLHRQTIPQLQSTSRHWATYPMVIRAHSGWAALSVHTSREKPLPLPAPRSLTADAVGEGAA